MEGPHMKILFINGSPRKDGNTNRLIDQIITGIDPTEFEPVKEQITDYKINFCLGCDTCTATRRCVQDDDYRALYHKFCASDIICLATPSYWGYVTGQLKVFFDRTNPYCNTKPGGTVFPPGKYSAGITIRAGTSEGESVYVLDAIRHFFSHLEVKPLLDFHLEQIHDHTDITKNKNKISAYAGYLNKWARSREK